MSGVGIKARGVAATAAPKKRAAQVNPEPPERHLHMLQQTIERTDETGKAKEPAETVYINQNTLATRRAKAWLSERIEASKKLKPKELMSEVHLITPALAELILLEHNAGNRSMRQQRVDRWTDTITDGRWKLVAQGMSFARSGRLNDGQHRLQAIVKAGRPVHMNVTFGEDDDCFDVIDTGAIRNGADALRIAGFDNTKHLAAGARLYAIIMRKASVSGQPKKVISNDVLRSILAEHPGLVNTTKDAMRIVKKLRCSSAAVIAALYIIETESQHASRLDEFIEGLATGANLGVRSPILKLREKLREGKLGSDYFSEDKSKVIAAAIVLTWNLWIKRRQADIIKIGWTPSKPGAPIKPFPFAE